MATATAMEHRALLAMVREGPDEAAAAAVTAFAGDINARPPNDNTVLHYAVADRRPLTVAALAARGDCNPNVVSWLGVPVLCRVAGSCSDHIDMATFLAQFPTVDIDACDQFGQTPLHYVFYAANRCYDAKAQLLQLLLDAGADPTIRTFEGRRLTPAQVAHQHGGTRCIKLLEAAEAWHNSLRREWLRAVVCLSKI